MPQGCFFISHLNIFDFYLIVPLYFYTFVFLFFVFFMNMLNNML